MKGALWLTAAASLLGSALASEGLHRRHGHGAFHHRRGGTGGDLEEPAPSCGCTTRVITYYGEPTLSPEETTTISSTSYSTKTVETTPVDLPTPRVTSYPTPGTYTVDPTTIVVTQETTVCGATSTSVDPGDHTYGGVTTVVETATTVVCPVPTVQPTGDTSTSVIVTTTFVCPSGGTYTIAPTTTKVDKPTVIVYPTPATFTPGTYTQPGQTITAVETDFVYICPTEDVIPSATSAPPPPPSSSLPPPPKPTSSPGGGDGDKWGITYSPYNNDGTCKGSGDVAKDIAKIKKAGFTTVRVYAPDCGGLESIGSAARSEDLKLIIGVFIGGDGIEASREQVDKITSWGQWDLVELVVVGNEAIFSGSTTAGALASFITTVKGILSGSGYTGPVTTTEPLNIWQESSGALCSVVDVVGANVHPYFNDGVIAAEAGQFVSKQMDILGNLCGKDVLNLETGWPSGGSPNGLAIPGVLEQATALASILTNVGKKSVLFSFTNDEWKEPGPLNVEQSWGCITSILDGVLKTAMDTLDTVGDVAEDVTDKVSETVDDIL